MLKDFRAWHTVLIAFFCCFGLLASSAKAGDYYWVGGADNNFSTAGNWSNGNAPGSDGDAVIRTESPTTPVAVTLDGDGTVVRELEANDYWRTADKAGVDLVLPDGTGFTTTGKFVLGSGSLHLSPGATLNTSYAQLGSFSVPLGSTTAIVDGATWNVPGLWLEVACYGDSQLTIENAGQVLTSNRTRVGATWDTSPANGTVVVRGAGSLLESGTLAIGYGNADDAAAWGSGTVRILEGGVVRTTRDENTHLDIGQHGVGTLLVDGLGSALEVAHNINLGGYNGGAARGQGQLTVQNGARLIAPTDTYYRGQLQMTRGTGSTFNVTTGADVTLRDMRNLYGTTIDEGASVNVSNTTAFALFDNPLDRGSVIAGTGTSLTTKYLQADAESTDSATLSIRNGAAVEATGGMYVGYYGIGNTGRVDVDAASLTVNSSIYIGKDAQKQGRLNLTNGAEVQATGALAIQADSRLDVSGGSRLHSDSVATMYDGSTLSVSSGGIATFGRYDDAKNWNIADSVYVGKNSQLRGSGLVDADVFIGDDAFLDPGSSRNSYGRWGYGGLTIDGDLELMTGSTLFLGVGNDGFDVLDVFGDVTLAGTVNIEFADDFAWQDNLFFSLLHVDGILDSSDAVLDLRGEQFQTDGLMWHNSGSCLTLLREQDLDYFLASNSPVPEPTSLVLWSGLGVMGLIGVRRRKRAA